MSDANLSELNRLREDPAAFFRLMGYKIYPWQEEVMKSIVALPKGQSNCQATAFCGRIRC